MSGDDFRSKDPAVYVPLLVVPRGVAIPTVTMPMGFDPPVESMTFLDVVTIYRDGRVVIADGKTPDEAAAAFWDAVRRVSPLLVPDATAPANFVDAAARGLEGGAMPRQLTPEQIEALRNPSFVLVDSEGCRFCGVICRNECESVDEAKTCANLGADGSFLHVPHGNASKLGWAMGVQYGDWRIEDAD